MADPASFKRVITYGTYSFDYTRLVVNSVNNFSNADGGKTLISTTTKFDISGFIIGSSFANFNTEITNFRAALGQPRQDFSIVNDGNIWFDIDFNQAANGGNDILYGPNCTNFDLTEFTGGLAASYTVTIEVTEKICGITGRKAASNVLQITRDTSYTIDGDGFTTRNISGVLVVTQQGFSPDRFKELVQVDVPKNFKRTSQTYDVQSDGITMRYQIVDQEQYLTLPRRITTGAADLIISTELGAKITLTLSGNFSVNGGASKLLAFNEIIRLLDKYIVPLKDKGFAFTKQEIKTGIYSNNLEFMFTGFTAGVVPVKQLKKNSLFNLLIDPPPGSDGKARTIPQGGSAGLKAETRPIDDGCSGNISKITTPDKVILIPGRGRPKTAETAGTDAGGGQKTSTTLNALSGDVSKGHIEFLYVDYHEKISYEVDSNRLIFVPKKKDVKQIVQQVTVPTVHITQVGYAVRRGASPVVPPPVATQPKGYILQESVCVEQPILQDDIKIYTTSWRYIIRIVDNEFSLKKNGASGDVKLPIDPRIKSKNVIDLNIPSEMDLPGL